MPGTVDGVAINVLLPSDYRTSGRSYPVLYLLHGLGGDSTTWLTQTDIERFTAPFTGRNASIVVMWSSGGVGWDLDWRDGQWLGETFDIGHLIPYVDTHFCTLADRAHRAIAGLSGGGYGAMYLAARHPDTFVAAGTFSGVPLDLTDPISEPIFYGVALVPIPPPAGRPWGDPPTDEVWFHSANPSELAVNYGGMSLYEAAGNGLPCNSQDVSDISQSPVRLIEPLARREADHFNAALVAAGVPHTTDFPACGIHNYARWQDNLHSFWPQMDSAFGAAAPTAFNYRRDDPAFSVWGWSFTADPKRAVEWLDIRRASPAGVTLNGSGTETVTTASYFAPGATIRLSGARERTATANGNGQITFRVDLGPPHPNQEYTAQAVLAGEDLPGYTTTRDVKFTAAADPYRRKRPRSHPRH